MELGGGGRVKKWFQGRSWRVAVINVPLGRAFATKKKKKERKENTCQANSFKSNTRIVFGNSPLLACTWFSYFLPKKSTASTFSLLASFAAHNCPVISATAKFKSQNHFFVCLLSQWYLRLTRSDPGLFPKDSTHPHKKLGLYDNENVRVLVFDIDWVFV